MGYMGYTVLGKDKWGQHEWGHCKFCVFFTEILVEESSPTFDSA